MLCPRTSAPPPPATAPDLQGFSPQPPIPAQYPVTEKECQHRHAAQKNSERHLIIPVNHLRRLPRSLPRRFRTRQPFHKPVRALDPHHKNCPQAKQRSCKGSPKNREHGQLHTQKRPGHRHQLHVAKSHTLSVPPAKIKCSGPVDEP